MHNRVLIALLVTLSISWIARPVAADPVADGTFVELMNTERSVAGLSPLEPYIDLVDDARIQTMAMMAAGDIYHSSNLAAVTTGWEALGENVGYGPTVAKLHRAFMASPHHRDNILGDYDRVGVYSDVDASGRMYVTVIFMRTQPGFEVPDLKGAERWPVAAMAGSAGFGVGVH
ncbi:MAG: CAP domain-containing protein [Acidimicrobiia bacterium]|nr:CAP domain-containing protein [Acidimicrobiia bacterium]